MSTDSDPGTTTPIDPLPSAWEQVQDWVVEPNPRRTAHSEEVRRLAVRAVAELLARTSLSLTAAAADVAANIGAGTNSVMRWCRAAGVGRDVTARDREWATRLDVMRSMNKALTEHVRDLDTTTADYRGLPRG
ncbi:hypothetical protein JTZ10_22380 [Gordonia rubripertincta]|jgi:hypothetical protein|uniref:Transposase n=1 Tax=Gordonia rubripertincta TaxID=36822 RepID=A0AAW4GBB9_GORRU|nr:MULTISPECIES: hypothetical protein [Gordonia]MAU83109.1 hypothetical protein [Gordonia sp. (in: high G+C Gram-positive bacteria)]MBM7280498.1 hypothetical protein [Gordonia rubripertincta]QMU23529.1 hypothetical protein H3V45_23750 [Gordonia rubripertincta]